MRSLLSIVPVLATALVLVSGCSVRRLAIHRVADALTGTGSTFTTDNDPELVRDALPFSLKLMEGLLGEAPDHLGLLTTLGSGFTQYGYAFVQAEAERIEGEDLERANELRTRARNLYLRGRDYCLRGLEVNHPGFSGALSKSPGNAVQATTAEDVPLLYWAAASWAAAVAQSKDDPSVISELPQVEALLFRALELDEDWNLGAIHTLLVTFEMSRTTGAGDPVERATAHFKRAVELSGDSLAGPWVSYAESVCIPREDRAGFEANLKKALALNVDVKPEYRLENLIMQRRARWLLARIDQLFLPPLP